MLRYRVSLPIAAIGFAGLTIAASPSVAAVTDWNRTIIANCLPGGNSCGGLGDVVPAGQKVTVRHVSCLLTTVVNVSGLAPINLERFNSNASVMLAADYLPPIQIGTSGSTWTYAANQETLLVIFPNQRVAVQAFSATPNELKSLRCYLSGDKS